MLKSKLHCNATAQQSFNVSYQSTFVNQLFLIEPLSNQFITINQLRKFLFHQKTKKITRKGTRKANLLINLIKTHNNVFYCKSYRTV